MKLKLEKPEGADSCLGEAFSNDQAMDCCSKHLQIGSLNTIISSVVKKEGTFQVKSFVFDQAKNYYDPVTDTVRLQYVVEVPEEQIVTVGLHLKK